MKRELTLFTDRLRLRMAQVEAVDLTILREQRASFRCDAMFELGVDLSDTLSLYEGGVVNETVVREAAVAVAVEALKVWLASCTPGGEDDR